MDDLTGLITEMLSIGPAGACTIAAFLVAGVSGGIFPRNPSRVLGGVTLVIGAKVASIMTGHLAVEMLVGGLCSALVLGYGLTRRGALRLALVGFALGSLGNVAVIVANDAMPFDDGGGSLTVAPADSHRYEPMTDSTRMRWLADTIRVPGFGGLASPGDLLLWTSVAGVIIAWAHSPDGKGGTGRRRPRRWYHARYRAAVEVGDWDAALNAVRSGLAAWPDDLRLRWFAVALGAGIGDFRAAADVALGTLDDPDLPDEIRGRFLDGYADALLMEGDPATFDAAEKTLSEAESLLPDDVRLRTSRALLALRRGDLRDAAAGARRVLDDVPTDPDPRALMVLLDTLLAQYWTDGQASPELRDLLESLFADPGNRPGTTYACAFAAYSSHAGDHSGAARLLRDAAGRTTDPDEAAAIRYHLGYVLGRSADATAVPEIDRLLDALPTEYPSAPARAHTAALRHLAADDPNAALVAASRALDSDDLSPIQAAEVHLTLANALVALGRHSEAARSRTEASRYAPHHQLLDVVGTS